MRLTEGQRLALEGLPAWREVQMARANLVGYLRMTNLAEIRFDEVRKALDAMEADRDAVLATVPVPSTQEGGRPW